MAWSVLIFVPPVFGEGISVFSGKGSEHLIKLEISGEPCRGGRGQGGVEGIEEGVVSWRGGIS